MNLLIAGLIVLGVAAIVWYINSRKPIQEPNPNPKPKPVPVEAAPQPDPAPVPVAAPASSDAPTA